MYVGFPDPRLKLKAALRPVDADLIAIGEQLRGAAAAADAYGLAGHHIGAIDPVIVVSLSAPEAVRDYRVFYNPVVVDSAEALDAGPEGSVAMPGVSIDVMRPRWAVVGFDDESGMAQTVRLEGWAARVALHEIDQMNGVFFLYHLSRMKRDMVIRRYQKIKA
jgi:peptide deformylase